MTLDEFNRLRRDQASVALTRCCGCAAWVESMVARRPFPHRDHMHAVAEQTWWALSAEAWLEAFSHHPQIGDLDSLRRRFAATSDLAAREQSAVSAASAATLAALAEGNRAYQEKFGYIFIVCASGRSADDMLASLRQRINNDPDTELRHAAGEQLKITQLRLSRLLDDPS